VIKIIAADHEMFAHLLGLFNEAGYVVTEFAGGNEFYVPDDLAIEDEELHAEIGRAVRPGTAVPPLVPGPPGGGDGPAPSEPSPRAASPGPASGEEATTAGQADLPPLPPKAGPGSSRAAWADAALARKLPVSPGDSRDDLIKRVEAHDDR
jgi:hypothetical protein